MASGPTFSNPTLFPAPTRAQPLFVSCTCLSLCSLHVNGVQNFYPSPLLRVSIGSQPCAQVNVTDMETFGVLVCISPPGPGFGNMQVLVEMEGSGSGGFQFAYTSPVVHRVSGSPCDADTPCNIQVQVPLLGPWLGLHRLLPRVHSMLVASNVVCGPGCCRFELLSGLPGADLRSQPWCTQPAVRRATSRAPWQYVPLFMSAFSVSLPA
jgi:hypothetical protein